MDGYDWNLIKKPLPANVPKNTLNYEPYDFTRSMDKEYNENRGNKILHENPCLYYKMETAKYAGSVRDLLLHFYMKYFTNGVQTAPMMLQDAVFAYVMSLDVFINGLARDPKFYVKELNPYLSELVEKMIRALDDHFTDSKCDKITQEMVNNGENIVYRGELRLCKGGVCRTGLTQGFTSTTKNVKMTEMFTSDTCCLYEYELPVGIPYIYVPDLLGGNDILGEEEVLLPRGLTLSNPKKVSRKCDPREAFYYRNYLLMHEYKKDVNKWKYEINQLKQKIKDNNVEEVYKEYETYISPTKEDKTIILNTLIQNWTNSLNRSENKLKMLLQQYNLNEIPPIPNKKPKYFDFEGNINPKMQTFNIKVAHDPNYIKNHPVHVLNVDTGSNNVEQNLQEYVNSPDILRIHFYRANNGMVDYDNPSVTGGYLIELAPDNTSFTIKYNNGGYTKSYTNVLVFNIEKFVFDKVDDIPIPSNFKGAKSQPKPKSQKTPIAETHSQHKSQRKSPPVSQNKSRRSPKDAADNIRVSPKQSVKPPPGNKTIDNAAKKLLKYMERKPQLEEFKMNEAQKTKFIGIMSMSGLNNPEYNKNITENAGEWVKQLKNDLNTGKFTTLKDINRADHYFGMIEGAAREI